MALKADYIVSGDKTLLAIEKHVGVDVGNPKQFLCIYKKEKRE